MLAYLKDSMIPDNRKIWKVVQDEKNHFKMVRDITTDKLWLY